MIFLIYNVVQNYSHNEWIFKIIVSKVGKHQTSNNKPKTNKDSFDWERIRRITNVKLEKTGQLFHDAPSVTKLLAEENCFAYSPEKNYKLRVLRT